MSKKKKDQLDKFIEGITKPSLANDIIINKIQKEIMQDQEIQIEGLIEFEIVDKPIKEVKSSQPKISLLSQSIYNGVNKLIVDDKKSLFIPFNVLPEIKHPYSVIKVAVTRLVSVNKNAGNIVEYKIKVSKDANNNILGYYIWRLQ